MTDITIRIPQSLDIDGAELLTEDRVPLLSANKIGRGTFHPDRIPADFLRSEDALNLFQPISSALDLLAQLSISEFGALLLTLADADAAREYLEILASGDGGGGGSTILDDDLVAIAQIVTTAYGRSLLALADPAAARSYLGIPQIVDSPDDIGAQPVDPDLTAIAQLVTTAYGRSLLILADAAAARAYLGIPQIVDSPDDIGAQPVDPDLTAIAQLVTTAYGRSLLILADAAAARAYLGIPQIVDSPDDIGAQPVDPDLTAIAQLSTTAFGRSLLVLADAAALQTLVGTASNPTVAALAYTVSQSSVQYGATGTYALLTDGVNTTGAGTANGAGEWIMADLGATKYVDYFGIAGGAIAGGWGSTSSYLVSAISEVSFDGSNWIRIREGLPSITDTNNLNFFNLNRRLRYLRFRKDNWLGMTGLFIYGY